MNKKVFIFLGGILLLIIITISFILFLSRNNSAPQQQPSVNNSGAGQPANNGGSSGGGNSGGQNGNTGSSNGSNSGNSGNGQVSTNATGGLAKISDTQVVGPILSFQNREVWYFAGQGQLYKLNLNSGLKQKYLLPANLQIDDVIWSNDGNDFIAVTKNTDGSKTFNYYNSQTKAFTLYPKNVKEVDFMPQTGQVAYQWTDDSGKSTLSTANYDLTGHKTVIALPDPDDVIKVSPIGNKILAYKNNALTDGKFYYIPLDTPKIVTIKTGPVNQVLWSKDGEHFVFDKLSASDPTSKQLWLGDIITGKDVQMNVVTPTSKISFNADGSKMYFAVAALDGSGDSFWVYDVAGGAKKQFYSGTSDNKIDSSNLLISNDATKLYFVNSDGYFYSVDVQ